MKLTPMEFVICLLLCNCLIYITLSGLIFLLKDEIDLIKTKRKLKKGLNNGKIETN